MGKNMEEVYQSQLRLFSARPQQLTVGEHKYETVFSKTPLNDARTMSLEFTAPADKMLYTDLKNSYLFLKVRLAKSDGSALDAAPEIGPVQNPLGSMFKNCAMFLNDAKISPNEDQMPYIAWLHLQMQPYEAKSTWMTQMLWYDDDYKTTAVANNANPQAAANAVNDGLKSRAAAFAEGKIVNLIGQLFTPAHLCERFLLPNCKLDWKMDLKRKQFYLMTNSDDAPLTGANMIITYAAILLKRIAVSPSLAMEQARMLQTRNAVYMSRYMLTRTYVIPAGAFEFTFVNAFTGKDMPTAIFAALVKPAAIDGNLKQNPYLFPHGGLKSLECQMGTRRIPAIGCAFDHAAGETQQAQWEMWRALNVLGSGIGPHGFTRKTFSTGLSVYGFDLSRDANTGAFYDNSAFDATNITITGKFTAGTGEVYDLLVWGLFNGQMEINKFYQPLISWA